MGLINLKKSSNYDVEKWLLNSIPELTDYQKEKIHDDEIIRFSPFEFYESKKKQKNIFVRLTIVFIPFVWMILFLGLPFNFILTGTWGYKNEKIKWFTNWLNSCGF